MKKPKLLVVEGKKTGQILIGSLVRDVQNHDLYLLTPQSYLQHGRLRECYCDCGQVVLYSEYILSSGEIKSCGCLRKRKQESAFVIRVEREKLKAERKSLDQQIRAKQHELKILHSAPQHIRLTKESGAKEEAIAADLRKLFAMKAHATRRINSHVRPTKQTPGLDGTGD